MDEDDKPILDAIRNPSIARVNRNCLRGLYSVIKSCDAHVRFCFLTGVTKFSKVNLFSGLINLRDITLNPAYSSICGYTEHDLETVFGPELSAFNRAEIRDWYNGYNWGGTDEVYNPFDMLLLFAEREFKAWWFETGSPTFLIDTLVECRVQSHSFEGMLATEELLSEFDIGMITPEALLFQTGYLTIVHRERLDGEQYYTLSYPN